MPNALGFVVVLLVCFCGMAWLALALPAHWQQVRGASAPPATARTLRIAGSVALFVSLLACFAIDHATMAGLVWVMSLSASALGVAFTLAWRPRLLAVLVAWVKP